MHLPTLLQPFTPRLSRLLRAALALGMLSFASLGQSAASIEVACIQVEIAGTRYEQCANQALVQPPGMRASVQNNWLADGTGSLVWSMRNASGANIDDIKFSSLVDVDINADEDTFFNEYAELINLSGAPGELGATQWEVDEIGYARGTLRSRVLARDLRNQSQLLLDTPDDAAVGKVFAPVRAEPQQEIDFTIRVLPGATQGVVIRNVGSTEARSVVSALRIRAAGLPPVVAISSPAASSVLYTNQAANILASASSPNATGRIDKVEFYLAGNKIGESNRSPFSIPYTPRVPGQLEFTARAIDEREVTSTSSMVRVNVVLADTTPNDPLFNPRVDVPLGSVQTSNEVILAGINVPITARVLEGEIAVNGSAFGIADVVIRNGDRLQMRRAAAVTAKTKTTVSLSINRRLFNFDITTADIDTTPDEFSFAPKLDVVLGSTQESEEVTLAGMNLAAPIFVVGGEYRINGGAWSNAGGQISSGNRLQLRQIASSLPATTGITTVTVGARSVPFSVTTRTLDTTPDPFGFPPLTGVELDSLQVSQVITPRGYTDSAPITVQNGRYRINGGAWSSSAGTIRPTDTVQMEVRASSVVNTTVIGSVTIDGVVGQFLVSTRVSTDGVPDPFAFAPRTGVDPNILVESAVITPVGYDIAAPVSIIGGEFRINGGAWQTGSSGNSSINPGQTVQVRVRSASVLGASVSTTLSIGGVAARFDVTTALSTASCPNSGATVMGNGNFLPFNALERAEIRWVPDAGWELGIGAFQRLDASATADVEWVSGTWYDFSIDINNAGIGTLALSLNGTPLASAQMSSTTVLGMSRANGMRLQTSSTTKGPAIETQVSSINGFPISINQNTAGTATTQTTIVRTAQVRTVQVRGRVKFAFSGPDAEGLRFSLNLGEHVCAP